MSPSHDNNNNSSSNSYYCNNAAAASSYARNNNNNNGETTEEALDALWEKVMGEIALIEPGELLLTVCVCCGVVSL